MLCGRAVQCVVEWYNVLGQYTVCYGGIQCGMAVYCVVGRCILW